MPYDFNDLLDDPIATAEISKFVGMDGYTKPTQLPDGIHAILENRVVSSNGKCNVRPGFGSLGGDAIRSGYTSLVQGARFFSNGASRWLASVCNKNLHLWDGSVMGSAVGGWNASNTTGMVSVEWFNNRLYLADGSQRIFEFDGTNFTQLNGGSDPAIGAGILCAHAGRLFASGFGSNPVSIRASSILNAGTGQWDAANYSFNLGNDYDPVTCMVSMFRNWLVVFKENSIWMLNADPAATMPTGTLGAYVSPTASWWQKNEITRGMGCVGPRAAVRAGGDCWFWSNDGIRSIKSALGTEDSFEIVPPMSQPIQSLINRVNQNSLKSICAGHYREYVFFAAPLDSATVPNYVFVYNMRLGTWTGFWTGLSVTCFEVTRFDSVAQRLVIGTGNARLQQWKDLENIFLENTFTDDGVDIRSTVRTCSVDYGDIESTKDGDYFQITFDPAYSLGVSVFVYLDEVLSRAYSLGQIVVQNQLPLNLPFNLAQHGSVLTDYGDGSVMQSIVQNRLPLSLPFNLAQTKQFRVKQNIDSLGTFHSIALEIRSESGNNTLVSASVGAYLNSVRD